MLSSQLYLFWWFSIRYKFSLSPSFFSRISLTTWTPRTTGSPSSVFETLRIIYILCRRLYVGQPIIIGRPKSDEHQFSPNNIKTSSRKKVENKWNDDQREMLWSFIKFFLLILKEMYEISVENLDEDIRIFLYLQGVVLWRGSPAVHNSLHNINRYIIRAGIQSLGYLCNNFKRNGCVYFIAVWAFLFVQTQQKIW